LEFAMDTPRDLEIGVVDLHVVFELALAVES
jgi:hypothetical protein